MEKTHLNPNPEVSKIRQLFTVPPTGTSGRVCEEILLERLCQIQDMEDVFKEGQLAGASACYAMTTVNIQNPELRTTVIRLVDDLWPWARSFWKPTTRRRNLVKAAALLVAEIERLDRATASAWAANQPKTEE